MSKEELLQEAVAELKLQVEASFLSHENGSLTPPIISEEDLKGAALDAALAHGLAETDVGQIICIYNSEE